MKKFFSEYGHLTLAAVIVALLVAMASPVGNLIKASSSDLVNTFGEETNTLVSNFEVVDLNYSEQNTSYSVTIRFENGVGIGHFDSITIYDGYCSMDPVGHQSSRILSDGNIIGQITSANGLTTVQTKTGIVSIKIKTSNVFEDFGTISLTGGVSDFTYLEGFGQVIAGEGNLFVKQATIFIGKVTSDGTIIVSEVDWSD